MDGVITSRSTSDYNTVTDTAQQLANLVDGCVYRLVCSIDTWVKVGANPTASAADDSHYLAAGQTLLIRASANDDNVSVLRVGAANGVCTLSKVG